MIAQEGNKAAGSQPTSQDDGCNAGRKHEKWQAARAGPPVRGVKRVTVGGE